MIIIHKKIIISLILLILWAVFIFGFSNMNTNESNSKSKSTINEIIEKSVEATNGLGITDKHPSENKMKQVIEKLNQPLRKVAHASEYFILSILIIFVLNNIEVKGNKIYFITILICFIYACIDEYHQTFVNGRTGQFIDTLIDTAGATIGCILVIIKNKIWRKNRTKEIENEV